ncbi:hypothetical protein EZH22_03975 [Xanthobacter dioxanivorans]|uniref:Uncharacterized protein n=1 Tax=Xanthobacter dioxanivorans TaxID=2528964 RepID=A0A974PR01_9HYPH|nr:hypothetical protein [Xanthobacter dioxanivorans]QRG07565.1 hypothetical protein EZH22_03975 [Xanthobacter dioxanivorans]
MSELTRRIASLSDVQGIWGLLRQVSAEVPFKMDDELEQESILSELMACCTSGLSPVLVDNEKGIVGALLARRDDFDWGFLHGEAIHVAYAAVAPGAREEKVLPALLGELQGRKVPLLASVKSGEQLGFAVALGELGFTHEVKAESGWGDLYQWSPPPSVHN